MSDTPVVRFENVTKTYQIGAVAVEALKGLSLAIGEGEYVSITGPSGCGKSTLLNVLGCLDRPTSGQYFLGEQDVSAMDDDTLSAVRGARLGFVFQSYNLIQQLSVVENIEIPLYYQGYSEKESHAWARDLALRVGLGARLEHRPAELSGGQQQRVAIARALANDPLIILADEPTGNLDTHTSHIIMTLLADLHKKGITLVIVTHEEDIAAYTERTIYLRDGKVVEEKTR
jgi:putative ABC transport system ATP-binding protein